MKSSKIFAKSRTICLLIGFVMVAMILPGVVSAARVSSGTVPVAQFTALPVNGYAPLTVQFTDQSTYSGTPTYQWDINNDGRTDYTSRNPKHTYTKTGTYSVKLTVRDSRGRDSETKTGYITVTTAPPVQIAPVAAFTSDKQSGYTPLAVQFTDQSTGTTPLTYVWDFGDGGTSTAKNPSHTYATEGIHTVTLTVTNAKGSDRESKTDYIRVSVPPPAAQFTASSTTGPAPLTVQFTDTSVSSGDTGYAWDFGDGDTDITSDPTHTYTTEGLYTVILTVSNTQGTDSKIRTNYIHVVSSECWDGFGAEACDTDNLIGGGAGYNDIKTTGDHIVTNKAELLSALSGATSGEVIYVTEGTTIDLTGQYPVGIPAGVTLASNRGEAGSDGALIKKSAHTSGFIGAPDINGWYSSGWEEPMFYAMGNDVRITGLQLQGEMYPQDYGNAKKQTPESNYLVGIFANAKSGFEVDNNEIRGWAWSGISMKACPDAYIHHNYIHLNQARGEGYGSNLYGGNALFEANLYDYNRHAITGAGFAGEQYEARYNIILGNGDAIGGHHFDVHQDENGGTFAGDKYLIHHNTFRKATNGGNILASVGIRQRPTTGVYIKNNLFQAISTETEGGVPIWERDSTQNMYATNNMWMGKIYPTNTGIVWFL